MKKIILFVMIFMFSLTLYGCDFGNPNKRFIDFTTNGKYGILHVYYITLRKIFKWISKKLVDRCI